MRSILIRRCDPRRRGAVAAMVMVSMVVMFGFAALTIDTGILYNTRSEIQRSADAAAMAGALRLMDDQRLKGGAYLTSVLYDSRAEVASYVARNLVGKKSLSVPDGDITVGYLTDPTDPTETMDFSDMSRANAVRVVVRQDQSANGPVALTFSWIFGKRQSSVSASATAALMDGINGFRVTPESGNAGILPLTLKREPWLDLMAGTFTSGDNWAYDPETGTVSPGSDGVLELDFYPGGGAGQLPPGNFGTVDIGSNANSSADLSRQITDGVTAEDLAYHGGELALGDDGTLDLNGDTGLSAGIQDELKSIVGQARAIPLFSQVAGNGNNANFTIVGFVGIRVMSVKLNGSMNSKRVIVQPAIIVDDSAIAGPSDGSSYFVYQPVQIVR